MIMTTLNLHELDVLQRLQDWQLLRGWVISPLLKALDGKFQKQPYLIFCAVTIQDSKEAV